MAHAKPQTSPIRGVVLAGGHSRRLGMDKRALQLHFADSSRSLLGWSIDRLEAVVGPPLVAIGERPGGLPSATVDPEVSRHLVFDEISQGPLAGLLAATAASPKTALMALACDLPFVSVSLLEALLTSWKTSCADIAAVQHKRHWEPLVAIYGPRSFPKMAERAHSGRRSLHPLLDDPALTVVACQPGDLDLDRELFNLNTAEDLAAAQELAGSTKASGCLGSEAEDSISRR